MTIRPLALRPQFLAPAPSPLVELAQPQTSTEARLRSALHAGRLGFWELDLASGRLDASETCKANFGRPLDEPFTYADLRAAIHPDDQARVGAAIDATMTTGADYDIEYRLVRPDGHEAWILVRGQLTRSPDGTPTMMSGISMDITSRKEQDAALARSRQTLQAITDSIDHMVWSTDADGVTDFCNQRWYDYTGMPADLPLAAAWDRLVHPEDDVRALAAWRRSVATGRPFREEYRLRHRSGAYRWNLSQAQAVVDADGRVLRWHGTCTDIQQIVEARELLSHGKEELQRVVEQRTLERDRAWKHSLDLQLIIGPDGFIRAANEAWGTLLGWHPDEVVGKHFSQFTPSEDLGATEDAVKLARDDALRRFEKRCLHKDGGFRWVSWMATPEDDSVYASGRDVTQERESAAALGRMERQLRQSQKMEALGQLTGGLAHDFNNYLGVISNTFATLREVVSGADLAIARGERASQQAASLTHRLLSFAREQPMRPEATDLRELLRESSALIRSGLPPSIDFTLALPADGSCTAFVDANLLDNALLNLCFNARDAMPDGGRLTLSAAEVALDAAEGAALDLAPGTYARIEIADQGIGMTEAVRSRIFDPFFTTKAPGQGTGLGLSMVYGFARQSKGQVTADSVPGQGTVMRLYLPRKAAA